MKIKNLLFDFGEVLVTLSREKAVAAFRALGAEIADEIVPASWSFDGMFRDLENGKITEREFFDNLNFSSPGFESLMNSSSTSVKGLSLLQYSEFLQTP